MTNNTRISLCMITKDEEEWLPQALESVEDIVSEIIVVDTGSSDSTVEIAKKHGAIVVQTGWEDDFSKPRNLGIGQATGDWILVLDADEAIDQADHEMIRKLVKRPNHCYLLTQRHYSNDHRLSEFIPCGREFPKWERDYLGYFESSLCRLFPNDPRIEYRGLIHELTEHSIGECDDLRLVQTPIRLHHYGHTPEVRKKKDKSKIYAPLGMKKTEAAPGTWKNFFELGVELNCNGKKEESADAFAKCVALKDDYLSAWTNYGYVLCELSRYDEAISALKRALQLDPQSPEAHCNLGVIYLRKKQWPLAEAEFVKAIEIKPSYLNAYSNLALVYANTNAQQQAIECYRRALEISPKNTHLLCGFANFLLSQRYTEEAKMILDEALAIDPECINALLLSGELLVSVRDLTAAKRHFEKISQLNSPDATSSSELIRHAQTRLEAIAKHLGE